MRFGRYLCRLAWLAALSAPPSEARVTRIQLTSQTPAFGVFGSVGTYENLVGVAFGELDPDDPLNAVMTDIELAPSAI